MLADIERTEKELEFANRKIKQVEDTLKKTRHENEQLKLSKKGLNDDLQKLLARRQDIENLQTTLMGIIQNSTQRKIDIDDLKMQLASNIRQNKFQAETSSPVKKEKEAIMRKLNGRSRSKSKGSYPNNDDLNMPERGSNANQQTLKMYDNSIEDATPVWYKTLKRNISK